MAELLLELFSEEIPARMQKRAAQDLARLFAEACKTLELPHDTLETHVTPRRLVLMASGLPTEQATRTEERRGPKLGAPEKALEGFLKSCGLSSPTELEERDGYFYAQLSHKGAKTTAIAAQALTEILGNFPWQKSMRWGSKSARWVRPLRNILCILDSTIVPVEFAGLKATNTTYGHRFLAPDALTISSITQYKDALQESYVVLDSAARTNAIIDGSKKIAAAQGLRIKSDPALLDEVTGLAEWPIPLLGSIDAEFMTLPREVLSTTMKVHQKYFTLEVEKTGEIAPYFLCVANMQASDKGKKIIHGNERVLRARLADAAFFWQQDQKTPMAERAHTLRNVTFHAALGSLADKTSRITGLAKFLAVWVPHANLLEVEQAAQLCKADLASGMVGEFPELQGIMGNYYAKAEGMPDAVAHAIELHYAPQGPHDTVPTAPVGVAIALADKMDSLAGLFAAGEKPTGSKDPYALRRAALGIIRLIVANGLRVPLRLLVEKSLNFYPAALFKEEDTEGRKKRTRKEAVTTEILDFMAERLKVLLKEEGVSHDVINAIFDGGKEDDFVRLCLCAKALKDFLGTPHGENLLAAYRRAGNILKAETKKSETLPDSVQKGHVDETLLETHEEKQLFEVIVATEHQSEKSLKKEDFEEAMRKLSHLRDPVDAFFEAVHVNTDNPALRANRLSLLTRICRCMDRVVNFAKIEG